MVLSEMPHLGMIHLVYESAKHRTIYFSYVLIWKIKTVYSLNEEIQLHLCKLISNNLYWFENEIQKCWLSDLSETGRKSND